MHVNCGHFGIAKTYNFSTQCPHDDDGCLYCIRTENKLSKEMLEISKIWRFFGTNAHEIIFTW